MRSSGAEGQPQLNVDTGPTMLALQLQLPKQAVLVVNQPGTSESAGGYYVVQVLSTKVLSSPSPDADTSQTDPNQLPQFGKYLLRERLADEGIRLSPRYGAWNTAEMKAVPKPEADVTGMLLLPKNDKQ
jgi:hypothetical protein